MLVHNATYKRYDRNDETNFSENYSSLLIYLAQHLTLLRFSYPINYFRKRIASYVKTGAIKQPWKSLDKHNFDDMASFCLDYVSSEVRTSAINRRGSTSIPHIYLRRHRRDIITYNLYLWKWLPPQLKNLQRQNSQQNNRNTQPTTKWSRLL